MVIQNISASFSELFPNYVPRPPLPRKVGGHDPPSSYGSAAPDDDDDDDDGNDGDDDRLTWPVFDHALNYYYRYRIV